MQGIGPMTKVLRILPNGWPCKLSECPPGLFVYQGSVCFKTEYRVDGFSECYAESGEVFWGGTSDKELREELVVQPCRADWVTEYE